MVLRSLIVGALVAGLSGSAAAEPDALLEAPRAPKRASLSHRVFNNLSLLSDEVNDHLSKLSFETFDMKLDFLHRNAKLKLDVGEGENFGLRIDSDVKFHSGYARVKAHIDLSIVGTGVSLDLPEFDLVPQSYMGKRWVEVRLPLFERRF